MSRQQHLEARTADTHIVPAQTSLVSKRLRGVSLMVGSGCMQLVEAIPSVVKAVGIMIHAGTWIALTILGGIMSSFAMLSINDERVGHQDAMTAIGIAILVGPPFAYAFYCLFLVFLSCAGNPKSRPEFPGDNYWLDRGLLFRAASGLAFTAGYPAMALVASLVARHVGRGSLIAGPLSFVFYGAMSRSDFASAGRCFGDGGE